VYPLSSEITVKIAISSNIAFLLSPKPGAFTAAIFKAPRNLFTTNDNASPSSSAIIIMVFQIELLVQELVIILLRKKLFFVIWM
jgi:hypothetical protein